MGTRTRNEDSIGEDSEREYLSLRVDDRGRVTVPKRIRDELGIEGDCHVSAYVAGSQLIIDPKPSTSLGSATSDRDDWEGSTPTDAGEALFGPMDTDDT
jgi:AbrB family looped-hinge helix DNA binding protein